MSDEEISNDQPTTPLEETLDEPPDQPTTPVEEIFKEEPDQPTTPLEETLDEPPKDSGDDGSDGGGDSDSGGPDTDLPSEDSGGGGGGGGSTVGTDDGSDGGGDSDSGGGGGSTVGTDWVTMKKPEGGTTQVPETQVSDFKDRDYEPFGSEAERAAERDEKLVEMVTPSGQVRHVSKNDAEIYEKKRGYEETGKTYSSAEELKKEKYRSDGGGTATLRESYKKAKGKRVKKTLAESENVKVPQEVKSDLLAESRKELKESDKSYSEIYQQKLRNLKAQTAKQKRGIMPGVLSFEKRQSISKPGMSHSEYLNRLKGKRWAMKPGQTAALAQTGLETAEQKAEKVVSQAEERISTVKEQDPEKYTYEIPKEGEEGLKEVSQATYLSHFRNIKSKASSQARKAETSQKGVEKQESEIQSMKEEGYTYAGIGPSGEIQFKKDVEGKRSTGKKEEEDDLMSWTEAKGEAERIYESSSPGEQTLLGYRTLFSGRGLEYSAAALVPGTKDPSEVVKTQFAEDLMATEKTEGPNWTYVAKETGESLIGSPTGVIGTGALGGTGLQAASPLLSSSFTSSSGILMETKLGLGTAGVLGGAIQTEKGIEEIKEGEVAKGSSRFLGMGLGAAGFVAGSQSMQNYMEPDVSVTKVSQKTVGMRKGDKSMMWTKSGGRKTPFKITVKQNRAILPGKKTYQGYGYLKTSTTVSGEQFSGTGEYGYGFPSKPGVNTRGQMFGYQGKVTGSMKTGPRSTISEIQTTLSQYTGQPPFKSTSFKSTAMSEKMVPLGYEKTPPYNLYRTKGFSGRTISSGTSKIYNYANRPRVEFTGRSGPGMDFTKGPSGSGPTVSLKGTFLDTDTSTTAQAATKGSTQLAGDLMSRGAAQQFTPSQPSQTMALATSATQQTKETKNRGGRRAVKRDQPKLQDMQKRRSLEPTVSMDLAGKIDTKRHFGRMTAITPVKDSKERSGQTTGQRRDFGLKQGQPTKPTVDQTQASKSMTATQTTTQTTGQMTTPKTPTTTIQPTPPSKPFNPTFPPFTPRIGIPGMGGTRRKSSSKDITKPSRDKYRPSVGGVLSGRKTSKTPSKFSGFELRFPRKKKDKKKRKKGMSLDQMIKPSGEV